MMYDIWYMHLDRIYICGCMLHTHRHGAKGSPGDQIGYSIKLFAPHNSVIYELSPRLLRSNLSSTCISPCPVTPSLWWICSLTNAHPIWATTIFRHTHEKNPRSPIRTMQKRTTRHRTHTGTRPRFNTKTSNYFSTCLTSQSFLSTASFCKVSVYDVATLYILIHINPLYMLYKHTLCSIWIDWAVKRKYVCKLWKFMNTFID